MRSIRKSNFNMCHRSILLPSVLHFFVILWGSHPATLPSYLLSSLSVLVSGAYLPWFLVDTYIAAKFAWVSSFVCVWLTHGHFGLNLLFINVSCTLQPHCWNQGLRLCIMHNIYIAWLVQFRLWFVGVPKAKTCDLKCSWCLLARKSS